MYVSSRSTMVCRALHIAAHRGLVAVVHHLLGKGADLQATDENGWLLVLVLVLYFSLLMRLGANCLIGCITTE